MIKGGLSPPSQLPAGQGPDSLRPIRISLTRRFRPRLSVGLGLGCRRHVRIRAAGRVAGTLRTGRHFLNLVHVQQRLRPVGRVGGRETGFFHHNRLLGCRQFVCAKNIKRVKTRIFQVCFLEFKHFFTPVAMHSCQISLTDIALKLPT